MSISPRTHYDALSRAFHWITAALVLIAFILGPEHFGRTMRQGIDPATLSGVVWHETLGIAVWVLTVLRLIWVALRPRAPQFAMPSWMHAAAKVGHVGLWVLLLVLPMTAVLSLGTESHPLTLLGGVRVSDWALIQALPFAEAADWGEVHGFLGDLILVLAGGHAAAALFHHFVLKDGVLKSMSPH